MPRAYHALDEIDRALSSERRIAPSVNFASRVMRAVRHHALAPLPLAFPWKRALPGLTAAAFALVAVTFTVSSGELESLPSIPAGGLSAFNFLSAAASSSRAIWILSALAITLVSVKLPTFFATRPPSPTSGPEK